MNTRGLFRALVVGGTVIGVSALGCSGAESGPDAAGPDASSIPPDAGLPPDAGIARDAGACVCTPDPAFGSQDCGARGGSSCCCWLSNCLVMQPCCP
jgi:hypothetical protein